MALQKTKGRYQIEYRELDGYRERWAQDNVEANRTVMVKWSDRLKLVQDLIGYTRAKDGRLEREVPEQHPEFPWLYAQACDLREIKGISLQNADGSYRVGQRDGNGTIGTEDGYAVYDVVYRPFAFDVKKDTEVTSEIDRYVVREYRFGTDSLTLPGQILQWAVAPKDKIPEPTARVFATCTVLYHWYQVPTLNLKYYLAKLGTVNDATFDAAYINGAAGTLLFQSLEARRVVSAIAFPYWDITFGFLYRHQGHNKIFRRLRGGTDYYDFEAVESIKSGQPAIYGTSNFNDLFTLNATA